MSVFQALQHESENFVRNNIAQLIGVIVKHELPTNSWPEIIHYVQQLITNERLEDKEVSEELNRLDINFFYKMILNAYKKNLI